MSKSIDAELRIGLQNRRKYFNPSLKKSLGGGATSSHHVFGPFVNFREFRLEVDSNAVDNVVPCDETEIGNGDAIPDQPDGVVKTRRTSSEYLSMAEATFVEWKYLKCNACPIIGEWPEVWKNNQLKMWLCSIRLSLQMEHEPSSFSFFSTKYKMMAPLSQIDTCWSWLVWSMSAGTRPLGLMARNSGVRCSPLLKSSRIVLCCPSGACGMEVAPLAKGLAGAGPVEEEEEVVGLAGAASGGAGAGQQDGAVQDASLQLRLGRPPRRWQAPPGRSNTPESGSFPRAWSPAAATWES